MANPWQGLLPAIGEPMPYDERPGLEEIANSYALALPFWVQREGWAGTAGYVTAIDLVNPGGPWQGFPAITYDLYDLTTGTLIQGGVSSNDQPLPGFWSVLATPPLIILAYSAQPTVRWGLQGAAQARPETEA